MFGTYNRLRVHVWASDCEVIRAVRKKLKRSVRRDPALRQQRKAIYRALLAEHRDHQQLVKEFRL